MATRYGAARRGAAAATYAPRPLIRRDAPNRRRDIAVDSRSKESTERERSSNNVAPAGPRDRASSRRLSLPPAFRRPLALLPRPRSIRAPAIAIARVPVPGTLGADRGSHLQATTTRPPAAAVTSSFRHSALRRNRCASRRRGSPECACECDGIQDGRDHLLARRDKSRPLVATGRWTVGHGEWEIGRRALVC